MPEPVKVSYKKRDLWSKSSSPQTKSSNFSDTIGASSTTSTSDTTDAPGTNDIQEVSRDYASSSASGTNGMDALESTIGINGTGNANGSFEFSEQLITTNLSDSSEKDRKIQNRFQDKTQYQLVHTRLPVIYIEALRDLEWLTKGKSKASIIMEALIGYAANIPEAKDKSDALRALLSK